MAAIFVILTSLCHTLIIQLRMILSQLDKISAHTCLIIGYSNLKSEVCIMQSENDWKKFEDSGQIEYYLKFKQGIDTASEESMDANDDDGAGAPSNENRGS